MSGPYELHAPLRPVEGGALVVHFSGWIDASGAAAAVIDLVREHCELERLATFDPDVFIDYRARRPVMELRDGVVERLVWSEIELLQGVDPNGTPVLLLTGAEPDAQWRSFADAVCELAVELRIGRSVSIGAYPFATPHTRPTRLACTASDPAVVAGLPYHRGSADVPAGMATALQTRLAERGIAGLGLWAQVPHYVSTMNYPSASIALVEGLRRHAGLSLPTGELLRDAVLQQQRIDQLVSGNDEHETMVRQMELLHDRTVGDEAEDRGDPMPDELPSADDLAAEVERFLRDQGA